MQIKYVVKLNTVQVRLVLRRQYCMEHFSASFSSSIQVTTMLIQLNSHYICLCEKENDLVFRQGGFSIKNLSFVKFNQPRI